MRIKVQSHEMSELCDSITEARRCLERFDPDSDEWRSAMEGLVKSSALIVEDAVEEGFTPPPGYEIVEEDICPECGEQGAGFHNVELCTECNPKERL